MTPGAAVTVVPLLATYLQRTEPTSNVLLVPFELEKEKYLMPELFVGNKVYRAVK